jgi:hypothetical protein
MAEPLIGPSPNKRDLDRREATMTEITAKLLQET